MIIQSKNVYFEEKFQPLQVEIKDGKITGIYNYDFLKADEDFGDNWILPGLCDIHSHGYHMADANNATEEGIREWMAYLPKEGVTATLPTTSAGVPWEELLKNVENIARVIESGNKGAHILGVHSEGPFISKEYRGAQTLEAMVIPNEKIIDDFQKACHGHLLLVMIAPEVLEDCRVIRYCKEHGIRVTLGHTGADFEKCAEAREAGAVSFTHTYNAMKGLNHRSPGTVGAAMYFQDMYAELIGDTCHVSPVAANILARIKGKDRLITVTDSVAAKGFPVGTYDTPEGIISVTEEEVCRLQNGALTGSAAMLCHVLGKEITRSGIDVVTAINSCTCNPMNMLGFGNVKGYIKVGYDADITVLDTNFDAVQTYVMGEAQL